MDEEDPRCQEEKAGLSTFACSKSRSRVPQARLGLTNHTDASLKPSPPATGF